MAIVTLSFTGLTDFRSQLATVAGSLPGVFTPQVEATTTRVIAGMRARIHSRTGTLSNAIGSAINAEEARGVITIDLAKAYYAKWVEYGHGGPHPAPAHPFIRPAVEAEQTSHDQAITAALEKMCNAI